MTGFSPDWLALREGADHRSRNPDLARRLVEHFADRDDLTIVDLGCGTGSNLRALAPLLAGRQAWTLVDYDPKLLAAARNALSQWAERAEDAGQGGLTLHHGTRRIDVQFKEADLNRDLASVLGTKPDLVTAAALFDLVSAQWIEGFAGTLAAHKIPLYTVLTYDGTEQWEPSIPLDEAVLKAFHAHQAIDKGFGLAAGPRATGALKQAFESLGYSVATAASPWRLAAPADAGLMAELSSGTANAAAETGQVTSHDAERWAHARRSANAAVIGHSDLLAIA